MHIGEGGLKFNPAVKLAGVHVSALPRRSQESPEERRVYAPPLPCPPTRSLVDEMELGVCFTLAFFSRK